MKPCVLVPIYDHGSTLARVLDGLAGFDLPILLVDDGSGEETARAIERAQARHPQVKSLRHARNLGRGAALRTGYRAAAEQGFTHALQLDADAQHDPADAPRFLEAAARDPEALVCGRPVFDESVVRARLWGRQLSRVWVWIETASFAIADPLCGYRCMPLRATLEVLESESCGDHMEFDSEIAVRLVWKGVKVVNVPTRVRYYADGISHFDMLRDNARISRMHARLFAVSLAQRLGFAGRRHGALS
jgi:glycosyltransferase involved in cell wall biosynthesis